MNRSFPIVFITTALFIITGAFSARADVLDDISNLIKSGNAKEIAKYCAPQIELTILSQENKLSKAQAETQLHDFFSKHRPSSIKMLHKITSNPNLLYAELILSTGKGVFRTSLSLTKISGQFLITGIQIEQTGTELVMYFLFFHNS